jgi:apolipoprotein N-acyltransferase
MKPFPSISHLLPATASGLLMTAAFPKIDQPWAAWIAVAVLLVSVRGCPAGQSFRIGFIAGLVHHLTLFHWLIFTMQTYGKLPVYLAVPVLFLLAAYLSVYWGVFSLVISRLASRPMICFWAAPVLWTALEYVRTFLLSGFPWALTGYSQVRWLNLIQIADVTGVYGVSFAVVLANSALFTLWLLRDESFRKQSRWRFALPVFISAGILASMWGYGAWRVGDVHRQMDASIHRRVGLVQGNIDQDVKWDPAFQQDTLERYLRLSLSIVPESPDLVVWPETATPFYFLHDGPMTAMVLEGIRAAGKDFLIGSPSVERRQDAIFYFNSAYLVDAGGNVTEKYDKVHLVPYGEYVPFKQWFPFLGNMVAQVGDFKSGEPGKTLEWNDARLGIQICFEIIFPELSRTLSRNGAEILITITNDAWFGDSGAPYQHYTKAVFRAVENRRSVVRAANTGISGFIDPVGHTVAQTPLFTEAAMTRPIPLLRQKSLYTRFGDVFSLACAAGAIVVILLALRMKHSPKARPGKKKRAFR